MLPFALAIVAVASCVNNMAAAQSVEIPAVTLGPAAGSQCLPDEVVQPAREEITSNVQAALPNWLRTNCGKIAGWRRVAYLNMTDPSEQCPQNWREYMVFGQRVCGRLYIQSDWRCDRNFFSAMGKEYSQVCGRIIGYRFDDPSGYYGEYYDGVTLTYGDPRNHIWSFFGARDESRCNPPSNPPPAFVNGNYFCESDERLWDGEGCSNTNCEVNNPPWFLTTLPSPTTEDIEISICGVNGAHDKDTPIQFMEIYVN